MTGILYLRYLDYYYLSSYYRKHSDPQTLRIGNATDKFNEQFRSFAFWLGADAEDM